MFYTRDRVNFLSNFITRYDVYAKQVDDGSYRKVTDGFVTRDLLKQHESGDVTVGFYQMYNEGTVRWICYDLDSHGDDCPVTTLLNTLNIRERLDSMGIPYLVERSGSPNSYHIWIFLEPVDVFKAYYWARELIDGLDVECEIFPKQSKPMEYGNLVKIPLALNRKTNGWSKIITRDEFHNVTVETVDISGYEPHVDTRINSVTHHTGITYHTGVNFGGMKPCIERLIKSDEQLTGTQGHFTRIAIVAELASLGWSRPDICEVFESQNDYDFITTSQQVDSVYHYNRIRCSTLRNRCSSFINCKGCKYEGIE
jgi:hypothetical protein